MKSNYLIYNTTDVKSTGTFREREEIVNINLISGYKPIAIAGWHADTSINIFLYNLAIRILNNVYTIDCGWKTFDNSQITNNSITVYVVHRRSK